MSDFVVNIDETNAARLLIEESNIRPVVVDFWADWCEPCKTLMPLLEKIANEYQGAFLLAKVNADEQGMIAQQFGVRSLPTVMIIQGGQPVDGFQGAVPESQIKDFVKKLAQQGGGSPIDAALEAADREHLDVLLLNVHLLGHRLRDLQESYPDAIRLASVDELRHHGVGNHHSLGHAMGAADGLQKIDDELAGARHHNRAGAETAITDFIGYARSERRIALAWIRTVSR